jgi:hypothetical protein
MDGIPILADDDLRQALSPKKSFRPLHQSLSVEEYHRNTDNDETKKIIEEYRNRGGVTAGKSLSSKIKQPLPPLPSELNDEYGDDDVYGDDDPDEEGSYFSRESDESNYSEFEDEQETETQSSLGNEDESVIHNALQLFCEQKRNTIQNIKAKKAQTKDMRMF